MIMMAMMIMMILNDGDDDGDDDDLYDDHDDCNYDDNFSFSHNSPSRRNINFVIKEIHLLTKRNPDL